MRALYLRQVNLLAGRIGEEQPDEGIAEDGGDFGNGAVEGGVAIAHERSPWKTTHDDLRLAVDASSGGYDFVGAECGQLPRREANIQRINQPLRRSIASEATLPASAQP
jgi:hypothetical protein